MKRGVALRVFNDEGAREGLKDAVSIACERLFAEADKNDETIKFETLKIICTKDFIDNSIRVEGTVESVPRPMSYAELMRMYCEDRHEAKKRAESMPQYDGLTGRMEEL